MAIYCDVCGTQLGWDRSDCCNADIIKCGSEDFKEKCYRCKKCGCICIPKIDKEKKKKKK